MKLVVACATALIGCTGGGFGKERPPPLMSEPAPGVAPAPDEAAIRAALGKQAMVADGGLYFVDPVCRARFARPRHVEQVELDGFAKCLAMLAWTPSARGSSYGDTAVVTYAPGFELEMHVKAGVMDFVGFSGRGAGIPDTPMIAPAALEALRTAGERNPTLPADVAAKLGPKPFAMPVRLCLDETGAVTTAMPASATVAAGEDDFMRAVAAWKFKPFTVGDQAIAACSIATLRFPPNATTVADRIPVPPALDATGKPIPRVMPQLLEGYRISGTKMIVPVDEDKALLAQAGGARLVGSFKLCLDEHGVPSDVVMLRSTRLMRYDLRIMSVMKTWRYRPYEVDGHPVAVCTAVTYIYSQK